VAGVIGVSLLLFVVSDFFGNGRGQRRQQKKYYEIGQISGEYVSYQDFELRFQNLLEIYKLSGRTNIDESTTESIREQIWQQMIREKILDPQYKNLGLGSATKRLMSWYWATTLTRLFSNCLPISKQEHSINLSLLTS